MPDITFTASPEALSVMLRAVRREVARSLTWRDEIQESLDALKRYTAALGETHQTARMEEDQREMLGEAEAVLSSWAALYRSLCVASDPHEAFLRRMCNELGIGPAQ